MKRIILILTAALPVIIYSCKKDSTLPPGGSSSVAKIKTWAGPSGITTYSYDASGRCVSTTYTSGSKVTWEYQSDKVTKKQFNAQGINDFTAYFAIGNDGLVTKQTWSSDPSFSAVYIYNSDKRLLKSIYNINGSVQTADYFYSNGNCDSTRFATNGNWNSTVKHTFYTDKPNTLNNDAKGLSFFGKDDKNLRKTEQYIFSDGSVNPIVNFTYEFDEKGRAVKETDEQGVNINISYISYF